MIQSNHMCYCHRRFRHIHMSNTGHAFDQMCWCWYCRCYRDHNSGEFIQNNKDNSK